MWCASSPLTSLRPEAMLNLVVEANSYFEGYYQHDSQELLLFVLNALSEETNRVKASSRSSERRDSRANLPRPQSVYVMFACKFDL